MSVNVFVILFCDPLRMLCVGGGGGLPPPPFSTGGFCLNVTVIGDFILLSYCFKLRCARLPVVKVKNKTVHFTVANLNFVHI